jgi:hypothetical protein
MLAWLAFLIAAFQNYFLAESGARLYHWNFVWGANITLFILFVVSLMLLLELNRPLPESLKARSKLYALLGIFALHVMSGIVWYYYELQFPQSLGG